MSSINNAIEMWKEKLLDFSLKNKLVNFNDGGVNYLELLYPQVEKIYNQLVGDKSLDIYDYDNRTSAEKSKTETFMTKEEVVKLAKKLAKDDAKVEGTKSKLVLFNGEAAISKTISGLDKAVKLVWEERGINSLFLTLGFIYWKDDDQPNEELKMPILLAPIKLVFTSVIDAAKIQLLDSDIILNPIFKAKMLSKYNINIPEIQAGESVLGYLSKIQSIVERLRWRITHESIISTFSFMKMQMYEDLTRNTEKISKNHNVLSLLRTAKSAADSKPKAVIDFDIRLNNVVDADSSQMEAIRLAKSGLSFVLQGPPGTGKSQTITNMIAELLYDEKKILFVSEKAAALQVVEENLRKVKLAEFCLELHSNKSNRTDFADDIIKTIEGKKYTMSPKLTEDVKILEEAEAGLAAYANEIHKLHPVINRSIFDLYEEVSKLDGVQDTQFSIDVTGKGIEHLQDTFEIVEEFKSYEGAVGYNYKEHEWYGYTNTDSSLKHRNGVKDVISNLLSSLEEVIAFSTELSQNHKIEFKCFKSFHALGRFITLLSDLNFFHKDLFEEKSLNNIINNFIILSTKVAEVLELRANIGLYYNDNIYELDIQTILNQYQDYSVINAKTLRKQFAKESKIFATSIKNAKKLDLEIALPILKEVKKVKDLEKAMKKHTSIAEEVLGETYQGVNTDWNTIIANLKTLSGIIAHLDLSSFHAVDAAGFEGLKDDILQHKKQIAALFKKLSGEVTTLLGSFDENIYDFHSAEFTSMQEKFKKCLDAFYKLENWNRFMVLLKRFDEVELLDFIEYCMEKNIPSENIYNMYSKVFYINWIETLISQSEVLSNFSRVSHDKLLKQFITKDKAMTEVAQARIREKLSNLRPVHTASDPNPEITNIMRERTKKRNQMTIYELLNAHYTLIQQVKPCFLMSPMSVSTYLGPDVHFDVVIFDEASQIFAQDAIGAMYRADQVIVVGDSKQMPPSDFFSSDLEVASQREIEEDINDFESLLDICSVSYHQTTLRWHYRSKTEDLITFSNKNFYKNELVSFPAAEKNRLGLGVEFHYFDSGLYDRKTRTNPLEAEWIAELVFDHYKDNPDVSLGVVAFSQSQQTAIEAAIDEKRKKDSTIEPYLNDTSEEGFFVRNLETVQGFERDTIIFSIGYAKDFEGKFVNNFGPLNRQGGERRLNVAVTRARYNIQVISSLRSYDIDTSKTESNGVIMFKDYLEYAEANSTLNKREVSIRETKGKINSMLEREIFNFLVDAGYQVESQIGNTDQKIGLAVVHPNRGKYMLAIETDGEVYYKNKSIRDRDRLRQAVLEAYGWNYYRIWSTDWFKNKQVEKERLLGQLKTLMAKEKANEELDA